MYTSTSGRIGRLTFLWYVILKAIVIAVLFWFLGMALATISSATIYFFPFIVAILSIILFKKFDIPLIIKRSHDINNEGQSKGNQIYKTMILVQIFNLTFTQTFFVLPELRRMIISMCSFALLLLIITLYRSLVFKKGTHWANEYGSDPLAKHS
jgi:uncharacterized membrane protein YhaH (DUF805 family)